MEGRKDGKKTIMKKTPYDRWKNLDPEKLELQNIREQQRRIKPGECLKYIKVLLDPECVSCDFGPMILQKLVELRVKYEIQAQSVPRTICWERLQSQTFSSDSNSLRLTDKSKLESHLVSIMQGEELAEAIKNKSLSSFIKSIQEAYPNSHVTLLIFGLKNYCRQESNKLKRFDIEKSLTEIQILHECSHRLLETAVEIGAAVAQFSKAIAEIPFKKQQADKYSDTNLYLLNDNKDCVRVEGTAGLSRLWQQHLTRLPLVTLETAEAVISKYPQPRLLFEAYKNIDNGEDLLTDLKVRRAGGPLTTDRRIGTELSRKLHTLYTSKNPNEKL